MSSYRRRNSRTNIDQELAEVEAARKKAEEDARQNQASSIPAAATTSPNNESVRRSKLGWQIRADLKKACQRMAVDLEMNDYEVLEMLLDEALAARAMNVEK
jgi:uncharacterized protein involved in propanediol utilization